MTTVCKTPNSEWWTLDSQQVSVVVSLFIHITAFTCDYISLLFAGAATSISFVTKHTSVAIKDVFGHEKHRKSELVVTKLTFVTTNVLSQQKYVCRDKHTFVAAKDVFCHEKNKMLVAVIQINPYK